MNQSEFAHPVPDLKICGAVLAGGQARRFGSDKAAALCNGQRLIDRAIERLERQVAKLVICGRDVPLHTCLADRPEPGLGPLGGLAAALSFAQERGFDAVLSTGCDIFDLPENMNKQLAGAGPAIVADQPVVGLWPATLVKPLNRFLAGGGRSLFAFADIVDARRVTLSKPLANINRPEDLEQLLLTQKRE
jgi:molybdopterin-guanine dinucleotide biosynthesis protein A